MIEIPFFSRHHPDWLPHFRKATIGIAGAGGLGSNVALCLVRAGIGRLILADFDCVEASNLNRQQFFFDQIGLPKVDALATNLRRVSPYTEIETHQVRLKEHNIAVLFGSATLLVEALDTIESKTELIASWTEAFPDRPLIAGNGLGGIGGNNALRTEHLFDHVYSCGDARSDVAEHPPLAPKVTLVAAMQANLVLELLAHGDSPIL